MWKFVRSTSTTRKSNGARDEEVGAADQLSPGRGLEGPHGCRADGHHPPGCSRRLHGGGGTAYRSLCIEWSSTRSAVMGWNVASPTVRSTVAISAPCCPAALQHVVGEVKAGGGRRHRARAGGRRRSGSAPDRPGAARCRAAAGPRRSPRGRQEPDRPRAVGRGPRRPRRPAGRLPRSTVPRGTRRPGRTKRRAPAVLVELQHEHLDLAARSPFADANGPGSTRSR